MMLQPRDLALTILFFLSLVHCGQEEQTQIADNAATVVITGGSFMPSSLSVAAGETVFFYNQDANPHRIVSQSAENTFDDMGLFSSDLIATDSVGSITVPEAAASGDTLYYYSEFIQDAMVTPNGILEVE